MADGSIRFELLFGVLALTATIAGCAIAVGATAFRKQHYLLDVCERIAQRIKLVAREDEGHGGTVRVLLIVVATLFLWTAFIVCLTGLRAALA